MFDPGFDDLTKLAIASSGRQQTNAFEILMLFWMGRAFGFQSGG